MSLPKTYKAQAFLENGGKLVLVERELKKPTNGEVLVKVLACGVCHTDTLPQYNVFGTGFPRVPGHEIIGDVVDVPESEKKWKVGDRVGGGYIGGHDGSCSSCQRGMMQACKSVDLNGVLRDGGYAEYVLLRSEAIASIPSDIDPAEYAPILCAGLTCFNAMRQFRVHAGDVVAVQGLGGLGHLGIQYANKMGFRVVALSHGSKKKDFALKLGAHEYIDTSEGNACEKLMALGGAKMILSTTPDGKTIGPLTGGLAVGGHLVVVGVAGNLEINSIDLLQKACTVSGWTTGNALDAEETMAFTRQADVHCMVEKFSLEDAQKAFDKMMSGDVRFRSVLVMQ